MANSAPTAAASAPQLKTCTRCGASKLTADFTADRQKCDGLASACRECRRALQKKWYDREKNGKRREARERRRAEILAANKAYYRANRDKFLDASRRWASKNPDLTREYARAAQARYRASLNGREVIKRRHAEPKIRLQRNISRGVHRGLTVGKGGQSTFAILGFTVAQLRQHLERQFKPGMTWENYGRGWHVDHIVPLAAHNFSSPDHPDFRRAWALSNLQPLWASENHRKSSRLAKPFQPSLALGENPWQI